MISTILFLSFTSSTATFAKPPAFARCASWLMLFASPASLRRMSVSCLFSRGVISADTTACRTYSLTRSPDWMSLPASLSAIKPYGSRCSGRPSLTAFGAIPLAASLTSSSRCGWNRNKVLNDGKNSTKRCKFLKLYSYFCHVLLVIRFLFCSTKS